MDSFVHTQLLQSIAEVQRVQHYIQRLTATSSFLDPNKVWRPLWWLVHVKTATSVEIVRKLLNRLTTTTWGSRYNFFQNSVGTRGTV